MAPPKISLNISTIISTCVGIFAIVSIIITYVTHENNQTSRLESAEKSLTTMRDEFRGRFDKLQNGIDSLEDLNKESNEQLNIHFKTHELLRLDERD